MKAAKERTTTSPVLRRQCKCGGTCTDCKKKSLLQRDAVGATAAFAPPIVHDVLASSGAPLAPATRTHMESRFRHDFSRVRVHTDGRAAASADAVNANAYTVGSRIAFAAGRYAPGTAAGDQLLAHELTHVVQQPVTSGGFSIPIATDTASEAVAERNASSAGHAVVAAAPVQMNRSLMRSPRFLDGPVPIESLSVAELTAEIDEIDAYERTPMLSPDMMDFCARMRENLMVELRRRDPQTAGRYEVSFVLAKPARRTVAANSAPSPGPASSSAATPNCPPEHLQKLCVFIEGGFNGDRSGVPDAEEMARHNRKCRLESNYDGADVSIASEERQALAASKCKRPDPEEARRQRVESVRRKIQVRSGKYMQVTEDLKVILTDPWFWGMTFASLLAYLLLWVVPEPVFTKLAAAALTLALLSTGYFTVSMARQLYDAMLQLDQDSHAAVTEEQIEQAAERWGRTMSGATAQFIVFYASVVTGRVFAKLAGPPPAARVLAAEKLISNPPKDGVVYRMSDYQGRVTSSSGSGAPRAQGNLALKLEPVTAPEYVPLREVPPANDVTPATAKATAPAAQQKPAPGAAPAPVPAPDPNKKKKQRPPFLLILPPQKVRHLDVYRRWLGVLQSDPNYDRDGTIQRRQWISATSKGGSHALRMETYILGHQLGLDEPTIQIPTWSRGQASVNLEVDHVVELQVTPPDFRDVFDGNPTGVDNYELLDESSNGSAGPKLRHNIRRERAKQVQYDPALAGAVLKFDDVVAEGSDQGQRWTLKEVQDGEHLNYLRRRR